MLYIEIRDGKAIAAHTSDSVSGRLALRDELKCENRNDWKTFAEAEKRTIELNGLEVAAGRKPKYVTTHTPNCRPAFDVVELPQVGDAVSYAFNGDYYPCGHVTKISATLKKITTVDERGREHHFYRRGLTGSWVKDGTWGLVKGHINERNPCF